MNIEKNKFRKRYSILKLLKKKDSEFVFSTFIAKISALIIKLLQ